MACKKIVFNNAEFEIIDGKIYLTKFGFVKAKKEKIELFNFVEAQVAGENKNSHLGVKTAYSSESKKFKYLSHKIDKNLLSITLASNFLEVTVFFTCYENCNTVRVFSQYKNIFNEDLVLEEVSAFCFTGIGENGVDDAKNLNFYSFIQSHHAECQVRKKSFYEHGLFRGNCESQKRISFANVGSWSTKEQLPQGIIENSRTKDCLMFQIESNNSWYYEIADKDQEYYLYLCGGNQTFTSWSKKLCVGENYQSVSVAISFGSSVDEVIEQMTDYRRNIAYKIEIDKHLPSIFNEYMHLSWDSPNEERVLNIAKDIAKTGVEYYVIDCGWHDEQPADVIYKYVGKWRESKTRFPNGLKKSIDYIHSLGLKAGLWIEPEIVGYLCQEMIDFYGDECFLKRYGKKICVMDRYFLDFTKEKVVNYLTETMRYMVEDLGADYVKLDYNQDLGIGTENNGLTFGEGLENNAIAYLKWVDILKEKFPKTLFETCSSGGMRMDYKTLSNFTIVSTSDQISYIKYPYIVGNVLSAVLPEQAAVWSYPVDRAVEEVTKEQVIMNMINSFLGRMHLASNIGLLDEQKRFLVYEGVEYYKTLAPIKGKLYPYFPQGFAEFFADNVCVGLLDKRNKKAYLGVWNLTKAGEFTVKLHSNIAHACISYPKNESLDFSFNGNLLTVKFEKEIQARFFEIDFS
ncbi:MAG: alpha-galactosidase [Clostridia bacterium]|nr:alpha-galactosidase [Clostridia bacterium]